MPLDIKDLKITARQFGFDERIPDMYSADGGNVAPELEITGVPAGTVELALIVHDPDAPLPDGFVHWVVYGIDPSTTVLDASNEGHTYRESRNGLGETVYSGPQPPPGHGTHHYYFWVYALDAKVAGEHSRASFLTEYAGNIIEQARHVGTFSA